jgi:glycosyltransferase involved in cell wall biosynthesis
MKIALLTDGIYPYVLGGMQKHSYYLAKYLAQNGVYVDLYHFIPNGKENLSVPFSVDELMYINLIKIRFYHFIKFPGHYLLSNYIYSKQIFRVFQKQTKVDIVYAKGFSGWYFLNHLKYKFPHIPLAVNFHGYEMFQKWPDLQTGIKLQIFKLPVLCHLKKSDFVISYGSRITELLISKKVNPNKIIEIPTGISPEWLNNSIINNNIINFVFIGRYERRKGIEEINEVLKEITINSNFNFLFHFIGPIPASKKILDSKVIYHGIIVDQNRISSILKTCDILICPSHSEGMPNVIMEAMASGCAIIATDVGAVSLLVNKDNGWLIEPGKITELRKSLIEAINCPEETLSGKKMNSVRLVTEKYLWPKVAKTTILKFQQIIK